MSSSISEGNVDNEQLVGDGGRQKEKQRGRPVRKNVVIDLYF